jgi:hypothetical protein
MFFNSFDDHITSSSLLGTENVLVALNRNLYPALRIPAPGGDVVRLFCKAPNSEVTADYASRVVLKRDLITLEGGSMKGSALHKDDAGLRKVDGLWYHSCDLVYCVDTDSEDVLEHAKLIGDNYYSRDVRLSPQGLPIGSWKRVGRRFHDPNPISMYDEFFLRDREHGTGWYADYEDLEDFDYLREHVAPRLVFVKMAREGRYKLEVSDALTVDDHLLTKQLIERNRHSEYSDNGWCSLMMAAYMTSTNESYDSPAVFAELRELLLERTALALDNEPRAADHLNPQPETAIEQSAPRTEVYESEELDLDQELA